MPRQPNRNRARPRKKLKGRKKREWEQEKKERQLRTLKIENKKLAEQLERIKQETRELEAKSIVLYPPQPTPPRAYPPDRRKRYVIRIN